MKNYQIVLSLFIFSEGIISLLGARAAYEARNRDTKKRTIIGISVGLSLLLYSLSRFFTFWNYIRRGSQLASCLPPDYGQWDLWISATRTLSVWCLSLAFMGGTQQQYGLIRRKVNGLLSRLQ